MQYSLRDERRDRHSGRIWRITTKGKSAPRPAEDRRTPRSTSCSTCSSGPNTAYRYWAKRELRERDVAAGEVGARRLGCPASSPTTRGIAIIRSKPSGRIAGSTRSTPSLLRELLACDDRHARAAATQQLRVLASVILTIAGACSARRPTIPNGIVRMEAAIAASYIGTTAGLRGDARRARNIPATVISPMRSPVRLGFAHAASLLGGQPAVRHRPAC